MVRKDCFSPVAEILSIYSTVTPVVQKEATLRIPTDTGEAKQRFPNISPDGVCIPLRIIPTLKAMKKQRMTVFRARARIQRGLQEMLKAGRGLVSQKKPLKTPKYPTRNS